MPSPDIREFVDLTLYDIESQSIYLAALDYMRVAMPEFRPVEGSVETVLMQAVAVEVAELVRSINRLPGGVLQALLRLFEVERLDGTSPSAMIRINGATSSQAEIPVGTRFFYQPQLDATPLVLQTDTTVFLTHGKNVISASIDDPSFPDVVTITTSTPHGFSTGMNVLFTGDHDSPDLYGPWVVSSVPSLYSFKLNDFSATPPSNWTVVIASPEEQFPATGFVNATGTTITDEFNGIVVGTELDILSFVPQIATVVLATTVTGGRNTESDAEYFARATANLSRANLSLVTADNYAQWVLNGSGFANVYRAKALDTTNGYRVTASGYVLLIVAPVDASADNLISGVGGAGITPADEEWGEKDEIRSAAMEISHPNLMVDISDPVIVYAKVDVQVSPATGKTGVEVANAVISSLQEYLSANTWDWSSFVRKNDLIARIYNAEDAEGERVVGFVQSVTISVDGAHVPQFNYYAAEAALTSFVHNPITNTAQATTPIEHGLDPLVNNFVAFNSSLGTGWFVFPVVSVDSDFSFTVDVEGSSEVTGFYEYYTVGHTTPTTTGNGDLVIVDPAPLVVSGNHQVTIV